MALPLAQALVTAVGFSGLIATVWSLIQWPTIAVLVVTMIAVLYCFTPNQHPRIWVWITPGSIIAVVLWAIGSAGLANYLANFGNYDRIYGSLAGAIILLLWLWLTNIALLFGAEINTGRNAEPLVKT